ncbi:hypothetical protein OQH60_00140 [Campylobacter sp. MIT 21-1685]|uniref:hypothetical protein n=1 Tax=unclassified Campylobacter TaxID=2593542 RepID=UPI00224AB0D0|nr:MULTISPECIES: hypothetical protein [unclassified Campylobacter]MCX2682405.1 hypothetical protein [Campylobacter sp. MIT 21-1684]MCX2750685.1 hypothetical protein [Campylobacter sp. MIT 21-1682]MCX2806767.1 hypothetical protein [Campylobacter sp. MIT 21-1685]
MPLNINEIAKKTLLTLKERKLKPTPENYSEVFEELSQKYGFSSTIALKLEKYKNLLLPNFQKECNSKNIHNIEQFISFIISTLNRQNGRQLNEFFELIMTILTALQKSKDRKIKELVQMSLARVSKTMESESIYLLEKKWKKFEKNYENDEIENEILKYGISKYEDFESIIKKLIIKLNERSFEYFAELVLSCLRPSLLEDLKIDAFIHQLKNKPFLINEKHFKNELLECVNRRVMLDNKYLQKTLRFFDDNVKKIYQLCVVLSKSHGQNLDFVNTLVPNEKGEVQLSFEELKKKFLQMNEKIDALSTQICFTQNLQQREAWGVANELERLDENYHKHKINYSLALFSLTNYRFIMEKYGIGSLNEIFVRFKKILKENCMELDELWMIDEKTYLVVSPNKDKDEVARLVQKNLNSIESFRFLYKQDVISPKISAVYLDKQSRPDANIFEELLEKIPNNEDE